MKSSGWGPLAVAALLMSTSAALAQPKQQIVSTKIVRSGETLEMSVELEAPYRFLLTVRAGDLGGSGTEAYTATEIRQWLAGRPHGPSPETLMDRPASEGIGERIKETSGPLGDDNGRRMVALTVGDDGGKPKYTIVIRQLPIQLERHEVLQFLRDIKKAASLAESLARKKD